MYEQETRGIVVSVSSDYLEEQSEPYENHYVWAYTVRIDNNSADIVQLKTRHWRIIDSRGQSESVNGDGVVGEQPMLFPGDAFEYTSGAPLATPSGIIQGRYGMETMTGEQFDVDIPAFSLDSPHDVSSLN